MKLITLLFVLLSLNVCTDKTKQQHTNDDIAKPTSCYFKNKAKPIVTWTFYKTTAKKPIVFRFDKTTITGTKLENNPLAVYSDAILRVATKTILQDDKIDKTISEYLFGKMMESNTVSLKIVSFNESTKEARIKITMNNTTKELKAYFDKTEKKFTITGKFDLKKDFNAGEALYFYHTAEFDKHKGADGKSKTWSEVHFQIELQFDMKC